VFIDARLTINDKLNIIASPSITNTHFALTHITHRTG
jgi:hypothetical protein